MLTAYEEALLAQRTGFAPRAGEGPTTRFLRWVYFSSETMSVHLRDKLPEWAWYEGWECARRRNAGEDAMPTLVAFWGKRLGGRWQRAIQEGWEAGFNAYQATAACGRRP
jgi:hypothetical protein